LEVLPNEKPADGPFIPPPDLPPIDATDSTHSSEGKKSSYPVADTAKIALSLLNATLDSVPVPGLKGIIGGILLIMDTFEVCEVSRFAVVCDLNRLVINPESRPGQYCLC
jgi:hypothetical protein